MVLDSLRVAVDVFEVVLGRFMPVVLPGDKKKEKQFFLVSRHVLSLKKIT